MCQDALKPPRGTMDQAVTCVRIVRVALSQTGAWKPPSDAPVANNHLPPVRLRLSPKLTR